MLRRKLSMFNVHVMAEYINTKKVHTILFCRAGILITEYETTVDPWTTGVVLESAVVL